MLASWVGDSLKNKMNFEQTNQYHGMQRMLSRLGKKLEPQEIEELLEKRRNINAYTNIARMAGLRPCLFLWI